jgi:hypothetical protein
VTNRIATPLCQWPGCDRSATRRGLCNRCRGRAQAAGTYHQFRDPRLADRKCAQYSGPIAETAHPYAKFCGQSCRTAHRQTTDRDALRAKSARWRAENPEWSREYGVLRHGQQRALAAGTEVEYDIDLSVVWDRDRGCCWICDESIDPTLVKPHPMSRSIDHVIPIRKGGSHTISNIALAHLGCNKSKRTRILRKVPRWQLEAGASKSA